VASFQAGVQLSASPQPSGVLEVGVRWHSEGVGASSHWVSAEVEVLQVEGLLNGRKVWTPFSIDNAVGTLHKGQTYPEASFPRRGVGVAGEQTT